MAESLGNHYVLGFIFDKEYEHVVIQTKNRPQNLAGMKNGLGGKIEPKETPLEAIVREVREEGGVSIPAFAWEGTGRIVDIDFDILVFASAIDDLSLVIAQEDEPLEIMNVASAINHPDMAPHVAECLTTALARHVKKAPSSGRKGGWVARAMNLAD